MLTTTDTVGGDCALPEGGVNWRGCLPRSIAAGLTVGFLTGLFGVGGGFLIIPAFVLLLGLPMGSAATTSLAVIVINSTGGFAAHLGRHPDRPRPHPRLRRHRRPRPTDRRPRRPPHPHHKTAALVRLPRLRRRCVRSRPSRHRGSSVTHRQQLDTPVATTRCRLESSYGVYSPLPAGNRQSGRGLREDRAPRRRRNRRPG
ncbi:TSUP family transporter [Pseudonocardia oceani]|uniref:TSUP family transporter n=1 Tax=Pseudonocardia oceani TaxID=2792013 RepID=UPI001C4A5691